MTDPGLLAFRTSLIDVLRERVIQGLFARFDALGPSAALAPAAVRFALVQASGRFLLIRLTGVRTKISVQFDRSMRPVSKSKVFVVVDVPGNPEHAVPGWNALVSAIIEAAKSYVSKHCDPSWDFAATHKILWKTIQEMIGEDVLHGLRLEIVSMLAAEVRRIAVDGDERKAVQQHCEAHRECHLRRLRKWAKEHVSTDVLTRDDFATVYDELLVMEVIDS